MNEVEKVDRINEINKDLLIITLLEYICKNSSKNNQLFFEIKDYLISQNIINEQLLQNKYDDIRQQYLDELNLLFQENQIIQYDHNSKDNDSRYKKDFQELEKLSNGGFGVVYKALHKLDGLNYAIKKIALKNSNMEQNFIVLKESRLLAKLFHPNIIRYYSTWIETCNNSLIYHEINHSETSNSESGSESDCSVCIAKNQLEKSKDLVLFNKFEYCSVIYIQMELCPHNLKSYKESKKLEWNELKHIFYSILEGIRYIHQKKIIHCDLSLKNILIDDYNNVKICDFGLAEELEENMDHILKTNSDGNDIYKSPESVKYNKYSYKTDIYSLGIIFFELLNNFTTEMERLIMINKFKKGQSMQNTILSRMICVDENLRPSIEEIINSIDQINS